MLINRRLLFCFVFFLAGTEVPSDPLSADVQPKVLVKLPA